MRLGLGLGLGLNAIQQTRFGVVDSIVLSKSTMALNTGTPTSAISGIAYDENGVALKNTVYYVSDSPTVVYANPITGLATEIVPGKAATANITGAITAPNPDNEPFYGDSTPGKTLDVYDDMEAYASVTAMGAGPSPGPAATGPVYPFSSPIIDGNAVDTSKNALITPGWRGNQAIQLKFNGVNQDAPKWEVHFPLLSSPIIPAGKTTVVSFKGRITMPGGEITPENIKWVEFQHATGRFQFNTHFQRSGVGLIYTPLARWQPIEQLYDMANGSGFQPRPPFFDDVVNTTWRRYTHLYKPNTADVSTCTLTGFTSGGLTGTLTWGTSQAGKITNGQTISVNELGPCIVSAFNGTNSCTVTSQYALWLLGGTGTYSADPQPLVSAGWSAALDGLAQMWIEDLTTGFGRKVIDVSLAARHTTAPDGDKTWCEYQDIACLQSGVTINGILFGGNETLTQSANPWTWDQDDLWIYHF